MERIPSGIPGLDPLIQGGIPKGFVVLVSGTTGSGKTTFLLQYIYEGLKRGERALLITFEQVPEDLLKTAEQFGMDLKKYEEEGKLKIVYYHPIDIAMSGDWKELIYKIVGDIRMFKPKRVAIDGLPVLMSLLKTTWDIRRFILELYFELKKTGVTTLITSEIPEGEENKLSRFGVEEFTVDGIIILKFFRVGGSAFGSLEVRKMRLTKHAHGEFSLDFTEKGLKVSEQETIFK